jgi:hypothetical protein
MPDRLSLHAPILINALGHCAGTFVFGLLFYFLLVDWRKDREGRSLLPALAAALALLWNVGSLVGIGTPPGIPAADAIVAVSFSVLSLLPAVLLHISQDSRWNTLTVSGYVISALAVAFHAADLITAAPRFHYAAILLITFGFALLTTAVVMQEFRRRQTHGNGRRLAASMALFLLALSFAHFRLSHETARWPGEAVFHHAGILLALFLLLQDFRFLLVDAFIRVLVNGGLAAVAFWVGMWLQSRISRFPESRSNSFYLALEFVGGCMLLSIFAITRGQIQRGLTRIVFRRTDGAQSIARLTVIGAGAASDSDFLSQAAEIIAEAVSARRFEVVASPPQGFGEIQRAAPIVDPGKWGYPRWVRAVAPVHLARGDTRFILLGARSGGRRYLSEDIELLDRLTSMISTRIERMRNSEMQSLVTTAELRALQAQINPHFLFNALNTIYGTIPREAVTARRLVLSLADLFRVTFASERNTVRVEEEMKVVRSYLEIEQMRLGSKLQTQIQVDDAALTQQIPALSIQPLVENAVRHGVSPRPSGGRASVVVRVVDSKLLVDVSNTGAFGKQSGEKKGNGVGLANVNRRLALSFGDDSRLSIISGKELTTVSFSIPQNA